MSDNVARHRWGVGVQSTDENRSPRSTNVSRPSEKDWYSLFETANKKIKKMLVVHEVNLSTKTRKTKKDKSRDISRKQTRHPTRG